MQKSSQLPLKSVKTATFFIDESGSKSSAGKFFVIGSAKTYLPGKLSWEMRHIRERHSFKDEFKFTKVKNDTLPIYKQLIDVAFATRTLLGAFVLDSRDSDQFGERPTWAVQAQLTAQLIRGTLKHGELGTVVADVITTPKGISLAESVKNQINSQLDCLAIVGAMDIDSRASTELQLADLFAGAVNYERKSLAGLTQGDIHGSSPKGKLVRHIQAVYGLDSFDDAKQYLVSIKTAQTR
ncbi:DUF3800 domain-containing protein [Arcanobacterium phocae]|uniref:DUF3800 domain-containing protein n=1 Tax=Arcanobacterium phocae TaxID=131112 RepID=UPI001C0EA48E|nr:DUF3800 domain-containing protein [Arcanobacterium phocae]